MTDAAATEDDYNQATEEIARDRLARTANKVGAVGGLLGSIAGAHPVVGAAFDFLHDHALPWFKSVAKGTKAIASQVRARVSGLEADKKQALDDTHEALREVAGTAAQNAAPKGVKAQARKLAETGTDFARAAITRDPEDLQNALGRAADTFAPEREHVKQVLRAAAGDRDAAKELFDKYAPEQFKRTVGKVAQTIDDVQQAPDRLSRISEALASERDPAPEDVEGVQRLANLHPSTAVDVNSVVKNIRAGTPTQEDIDKLHDLVQKGQQAHEYIKTLPDSIDKYAEAVNNLKPEDVRPESVIAVAKHLAGSPLGTHLGIKPSDVDRLEENYHTGKGYADSFAAAQKIFDKDATPDDIHNAVKRLAQGPLARAAGVTPEHVALAEQAVSHAKEAYATYDTYRGILEHPDMYHPDDLLEAAQKLRQTPLGQKLADRVGATQQAIDDHVRGFQSIAETIDQHREAANSAQSLISADYHSMSPQDRQEFVQEHLSNIAQSPLGQKLGITDADVHGVSTAAGTDPDAVHNYVQSQIESKLGTLPTAEEARQHVLNGSSQLLNKLGVQTTPEEIDNYVSGRKNFEDLIPDVSGPLADRITNHLQNRGINVDRESVRKIITGQAEPSDFYKALPIPQKDQVIQKAADTASAQLHSATGVHVPSEFLQKVAKGEATLDDVKRLAPNIPSTKDAIEYLHQRVQDELKGSTPGVAHIVNGIAETVKGNYDAAQEHFVEGLKASVKPSQRAAIEAAHQTMKGFSDFSDDVDARAQLIAKRRQWRQQQGIDPQQDVPERNYPPELQDPLLKNGSKSSVTNPLEEGSRKFVNSFVDSSIESSRLHERLARLQQDPVVDEYGLPLVNGKRKADGAFADDGRAPPSPPREDDERQQAGLFDYLKGLSPFASEPIREAATPLVEPASAALSPHLATIMRPTLLQGEQPTADVARKLAPGLAHLYTPETSQHPASSPSSVQERVAADAALNRINTGKPPPNLSEGAITQLPEGVQHIVRAEQAIHRLNPSTEAQAVQARTLFTDESAQPGQHSVGEGDAQSVPYVSRDNTPSIPTHPPGAPPNPSTDRTAAIESGAGGLAVGGAQATTSGIGGVKAYNARQAAKAEAAKKQAAKDEAAKEQSAKEQAAKDRAAKEQAAKDEAAKEQAAKEQTERNRSSKEPTETDQGESIEMQDLRSEASKEQAAREQEEAEQADREYAAREKAAQEQAEREQAEREQAEREQADREQAAREQAEREQAEREQAAREQAERDEAAKEQETRESLFGDKDDDEPSFLDGHTDLPTRKITVHPDEEIPIEHEPLRAEAELMHYPDEEAEEEVNTPAAPLRADVTQPDPISAPTAADTSSGTFTPPKADDATAQVTSNTGQNSAEIEAQRTATVQSDDAAGRDNGNGGDGEEEDGGALGDTAGRDLAEGGEVATDGLKAVDDGVNGAAIAAEAVSGDEIGAAVNGLLLGGQAVLTGLGLESKPSEPDLPPPVEDPVAVQQSNVSATFNPINPASL